MKLLKWSFTAIVFLFSAKALALDPIFTPWTSNLAIRGYDPVAYFIENKAVEGSKNFEFEWKDATWRFSSQENLTKFKADPESFAPQYGGYCAYAVAKNSTASIDPTQFSIVDGKLYLNYNKKIQQQWLKDQASFIEQADKNWPSLLSK
jgi:YHS domain-containing protein